MKESVRRLTVDGVTLSARIVRKRVRNVNARLVGSELRVSAPPGVCGSELDEIVRRLARTLVRRARSEVVNSGNGACAIASRIASRFPRPPRVTEVRFVTNQTTQWGSYSQRTGVVRLNAALRLMPSWVMEAIVAHELAHVIYPDHSPAFWRLLREVCPNTDRARSFLEGASWIAGRWEGLPPVEKSLLAGADDR